MEALVGTVQPLRQSYSPEDRARVGKAARDFEAFLLSSLLRSLRQTVSGDSGENAGPGQDDYSYMGTQALASALAAAGGIGLARLIVQRLVGTEVANPSNVTSVVVRQ
jgi:Rod binding domain-containing protein